MLTSDPQNEEIAKLARDEYDLRVERISRLNIGADFNTIVYKIRAYNGEDYFLKLRSGEFNEASILIPKYLADLGFKEIISPLSTVKKELCANIGSFKAILYPFIEGRNGIEQKLTRNHWKIFAEFLQKFHHTDIPPEIASKVPQETFSGERRKALESFMAQIETKEFEESIAIQTSLFLKSKKELILEIISKAGNLAQKMQIQHQNQNLEFTLCHSDIHLWNLLIDKD